MKHASGLILLGLALAACGRPATKADVKLVGVGYNPDEIGPTPEYSGGVLEYFWLDFAGGALNMATTGMYVGYSDLQEVIDTFKFRPPLVMVGGFTYVLDTGMHGMDKWGMVPDPPTADDACHTIVYPTGPLGYFDTVDVGGSIILEGPDGYRFKMNRDPREYPPDTQDVSFVAYMGADSWENKSLLSWQPGATNDPRDMTPVYARYANYPFASQVTMKFPGGLVPFPASAASIPLPSTFKGNPTFYTPSQHGGVELSWTGPRYSVSGETTDTASAARTTCFQYFWPVDAPPTSAADCLTMPTGADITEGQVYTGPWDTDDGKVAFDWEVPSTVGNTGEFVTLTVKFLAPLATENNEYTQSKMVNYENPDYPELGRTTLACESGGEWVFDPLLREDASEEGIADGNVDLVASAAGDPSDPIAEVVCRLKDDGHFELTNSMLASAMAVAEDAGAEGSLFYFTRTTLGSGAVPDIKTMYDQRKTSTPLRINARVAKVGRFNYNAPTATEE